MEFEFILTETTSMYTFKMFGNANSYRWESGGAFGSGWSERKWYSGIIEIKSHSPSSSGPYYVSFKTYECRDMELPKFNLEELFAAPIENSFVNSFCYRVLHQSSENEKSPFCFIEITKNFMNDDIEGAEVRIERREDSFG